MSLIFFGCIIGLGVLIVKEWLAPAKRRQLEDWKRMKGRM